jgi:hypothetical protein
MDKSALRQLRYEAQKTIDKYPGLNIKYVGEVPVEIYGNFKIIDNHGEVQGDYDIRVLISKYYPKGFHHLIETSQKIERLIDRHIDKDGNCCVEIRQKAIMIAHTGIGINHFFDKYVYKFFCWQLVYEEDPNVIEQWEHYDPGTRQFYYELLNCKSDEVVRNCLEAVLNKRIPERKELCACGSGKFTKNCHGSIFYDLEKLGTNQLMADVKLFHNGVRKTT